MTSSTDVGGRYSARKYTTIASRTFCSVKKCDTPFHTARIPLPKIYIEMNPTMVSGVLTMYFSRPVTYPIVYILKLREV